MVRFQIALTTDETDALFKLSENNLRSPKDQVRFLIRKELVLTKLLLDDDMNEFISKHQMDIINEQ